MSKVAKQCIAILAVLLLGALAGLGFVAMQKQTLEQDKAGLEKQVEEFRSRETNQIAEANKLKEQIKVAEDTKARLEEEVKKFSGINVDEMKEKISSLTQERDQWQEKLEALKKEREELLAQLEKQPAEQVVYKYVDENGNEIDPQQKETDSTLAAVAPDMKGLKVEDEVYWAQILKERTALELEVEKLRRELSQSAIQVTELKKKNTDMQMELTKLVNDKEEIERQIKYGKDLSDSLSLELARAQNDKKFLNDRLVRMDEDNSALREQIRQLTSTKIALERSIVQLQDDKKETEKKLLETENVIQGRIDEIWQIKKSLDQSFGTEAKQEGNQVELPPIVVSSKDMNADVDPNVVEVPGMNGSIVSVNNENNFVIIDIGQDQGLSLGHNLSVYRGAEYVAGLEIIQVRKDISAADIISKVGDIKVGDIVR